MYGLVKINIKNNTKSWVKGSKREQLQDIIELRRAKNTKAKDCYYLAIDINPRTQCDIKQLSDGGVLMDGVPVYQVKKGEVPRFS